MSAAGPINEDYDGDNPIVKVGKECAAVPTNDEYHGAAAANGDNPIVKVGEECAAVPTNDDYHGAAAANGDNPIVKVGKECADVPTNDDYDGAAANGGKENEIGQVVRKLPRIEHKLEYKDGKFVRTCTRVLAPRPTEDICNDGGLLKKILEKGGNFINPKDPDLVSVKYEARLDDGTLVASASDGGVEFIVRDGHFCPGLSKAVKTMCTGDRVFLTVKPQYGFGEKGKPAHGDEASVPPNAILHITLQLVSLKPDYEVIVDKKILKEGEGYECPNEGALVKLKLTGKLQDGTVFLKKGHCDDEAGLFKFKTDEEQVIVGLDRAVMTMKRGEVALLTIAPQYAFGSSESQQELAVVPPNSTLYYEVELVTFIKDKEAADMMNTKERIEAALKKAEEGNELYRAKKYARASKMFEKAIKLIEYDTSFCYEEKEIVRSLLFDCYMTNGLCKSYMGCDCDEVDRLCKKAVGLEELDFLKRGVYVRPPVSMDKIFNLKSKNKDAKAYGNMFSRRKGLIFGTVILGGLLGICVLRSRH